MTTITKERLLTIRQWRETYGPGSNVVLPAEEAEELARIALAALEVEPIGFRCRRNDNLGDWSYVYHREPDDFERKHLVIEGIYAAPPVPVVPEEKPMPNALSMLEREITQLIGDAQEATVTGYELIAEAWRLMDGQDPKTSDWHSKASKYLNSNIVEKVDDDRIEAVKAVLRRLAGNYPVTPDGWISCSERMPEMGERQCYVLAADFKNNYPPNIPNTQVGVYGDWFNDDNPTWDDGDGEDLYLKEVTHWMPLPEPPQEVK
ncbi:Valyl-tRNA synthetase [Escherichia coli]|nr:Valyl-tRNA synthetase [Escherichia coli]